MDGRYGVFTLAVIGAIVGLVFAYKKRKKKDISFFFASAIGALLFVMGGILLMTIIGMFLPKTFQVQYSADLVSLRDKSSIEGSFFIGSGYIGEKEYFVFFQKWGDGFKKEKAPAENSVLFQEEGRKPELVVKREVFRDEWMRKLVGTLSADKAPVVYEFHVPKGTIVEKFSVQ